jgi:hypothetical protein
MRFLFMVCAMAATSSVLTLPKSMPPKATDCPATSRYEAAQRDGRPQFSRLGDLPAADAYKAVLRHDGRCEAPIIIRYNLGAPGSKPDAR